MHKDEFKIGGVFFAQAGFAWRCTDVGTRTISAIFLDPEKPDDWFTGPPYSVREVVFDEDDMQFCYKSQAAMLEAELSGQEKLHPGFHHEDALKMLSIGVLIGKRKYPRNRLLDKDRVGPQGEILHPYGAENTDGVWEILYMDIFNRSHQKMPEDAFIKLALCTKNDIYRAKLKQAAR